MRYTFWADEGIHTETEEKFLHSAQNALYT